MNNNKGFISTFAIYTLLVIIILMLVILLGVYRDSRINLEILSNDLKEELVNENADWLLYELEKKTDLNGNITNENNWIYFHGFYWRILSATRDDGIRAIYSGTTAPSENTKDYLSADSSGIGLTVFNTTNHLEYVRYRYTIGEIDGIDTYSKIHDFTDNWMTDALKAEIYYSYTCDLKTIYDNSDTMDNEIKEYTTNSVWFESYFNIKNIALNNYNLEHINNYNTICYYSTGHDREAFSIITAEEVALIKNNGFTYLDTLDGEPYWTSSPSRYDSVSNLSYIYNSNLEESTPSEFLGVFPVIKIGYNAVYKGTGEWNDPYEVLRYGIDNE